MIDMETFTVAVFQDAAWARRGVDALLAEGFAASTLTILGKESPEIQGLCEDALGGAPERIELRALGPALARGPLVAALQGDDKLLEAAGIAAAMRRAGFQRHDGYIFEALTGRGGVLVAVRNERRAADALAKMFAYGGGNAAIGAWSGRV
jgi:hypothetical protein